LDLLPSRFIGSEESWGQQGIPFLSDSKISAKESCFCDIIAMSPLGMWRMFFANPLYHKPRGDFYIQ